ncbi:MAG TPA: hypothetical protein PLX89_08960 [Verrucomicrobiota bacterium]|nr:hypothetical protein [Verrucomicrobiota bacterium]
MECPPIDQQIAAYLVRHPDAQDTIEGIAEWWLLEQRIHVALGEIRSALTELAARGFLSVARGRDGRIRFSLNSSKEQEVAAWLAEAATATAPALSAPTRRRTRSVATKAAKPRTSRRPRGRQ